MEASVSALCTRRQVQLPLRSDELRGRMHGT